MSFKKQVVKELKWLRKEMKYHIRRTDILEKTVNSVWYRAAMTLAFLGGAFSAIKSLIALFNA